MRLNLSSVYESSLAKVCAALVSTVIYINVAGERVHAYPLDGFDETGISRLEGYYHSLSTPSARRSLTAGALLSITELTLGRSRDLASSFPPPRNAALAEGLRAIVGGMRGTVSVAVLDISDPNRPVYAGVNDERSFVPGSVGKIMVALSLFDALARIQPNSIEQRRVLLRDTIVTANEFIESDTHEVPFWDTGTRNITFHPLVIGQQANLWTYLDWMLSASSNAAGSMVMREVLLLNRFGASYPPSPAEAEIFFRNASPAELQRLMQQSFVEPMRRIGISPARLLQASFFTKYAKSRMPSLGSTATARDLVHLLLLIHQGNAVDEFSSLELKRLLYLTQRRVRYAAASVLNPAALYFKSGSLYRCRPEAGFQCRKYEGNVMNMLNAAAIVEDPVADPKSVYLVALSTDVLRQNAARMHRDLAARIHALIARR